MNATVSSYRVYHTKIVLLLILILCLLLSGCTASKKDAPASPPLLSPLEQSVPNNAESSNTIREDTLPRSSEYEYVIVQDYANNEISKSAINDFGQAINKELSIQERADYRLRNFGKDLFLINAAAPFEDGVLICGHVLMGGEDYCKLYYLEDGEIKYRAEDSDIWSLNYTVFKKPYYRLR